MNNTLPKQSGFTIRLDEETASDAIKQVENGPQPVTIGAEPNPIEQAYVYPVASSGPGWTPAMRIVIEREEAARKQQMTTTICGHDRENLMWALRVAEYQGEETAMLMCNSAAKVAFAFPDDTRLAIERDVLWAIIDPARLANVIGATLRAFGMNAKCWFELGSIYINSPPCLSLLANHAIQSLTMPQARALELRLLSLHDGATAADALKALEVRT